MRPCANGTRAIVLAAVRNSFASLRYTRLGALLILVLITVAFEVLASWSLLCRSDPVPAPSTAARSDKRFARSLSKPHFK